MKGVLKIELIKEVKIDDWVLHINYDG